MDVSYRTNVICVVLLINVFMLLSGYFTSKTSNRVVLKPYYIVKNAQGKDSKSGANVVLHNTSMDGKILEAPETTKSPSGKESIFKRQLTVPCNGTCHFQIQFCGYFTPNLPAGQYCCTDTGCTVKFIYSAQYVVRKESDAIILLHARRWNLGSLLRERSPKQVFIFMTREAGFKIRHKSVLYNMTMTHSFDSDFRVPYGIYTNISPENPQDFDKNWTKGKTKLAAWMASNCKLTSWPRTEFVQNLSKLMSIDMFGKCGNKNCEEGETCRKILQNYKFYFALENQLCKDYITEKFWYNALLNDVVPIVYGASRSEYEKVAPPHSFIHLSDFVSIKQFADYINVLDKDSYLYNTYFEWRKHGKVRDLHLEDEFTESLLCEIVTKLKQNRDSNGTKYLQMRKDFWDNTCHSNVVPWSVRKPLG